MAGTITALRFRPYRNLRAIEITMALMVDGQDLFSGQDTDAALTGKGQIGVRFSLSAATATTGAHINKLTTSNL